MIPYPWAANDHQLKNAQALEAEGAAAVIPERELSGAKLFGVVENLLRDEKKIRQMEENSLRISKIDAAATIVDACVRLMTEKNKCTLE